MMELSIYQINPEKDLRGVLYEPLKNAEKQNGGQGIDAAIYTKVFEGSVEADDLEEVYERFNLDKPEEYRGRSMSVSDVVAVRGGEETQFYYCDSIGFKPVAFDERLAAPAQSFRETIRVILCEPGKTARAESVGTRLEDLQSVVGGLIEVYYPFEEEVCIVCNDEGKINGMAPCRAVYDALGNVQDVICGPFLICGCGREDFDSLTPEQIERYGRMFALPEHFFRVGGDLIAFPYVPDPETGQER